MGVIKWAPGDFWESTPSDVNLAADGANAADTSAPSTFTRHELNDLMERFPDEDKTCPARSP